MNKISKTKRGFTLVEVMLALAIMIITIGVFYSVIIMVAKSHNNVASINDAADYAMLNARAFENAVINAKEVGSSGTHKVDSNGSVICMDGAPLFSLQQYQTIPDGVNKWTLEFRYENSANGRVQYWITVKSTKSAADTMEDMVHVGDYTLHGTVYIPHPEKCEAGGGTEFYFSDWA